MKDFLVLLAFCAFAMPLSADDCLAPKNPVPASVVCGHVFNQIGEYVPKAELQLLSDSDKAVVSSVTSDEHGRFMFPPVPKGLYDLKVNSLTWYVFWPVEVTASKRATACKHPLEVTVSITRPCGGGISKKGYHVKWSRE